MMLSFRHLVSTSQLSRADADAILLQAGEMEALLKKGKSDLLGDKILASLFYEPSTRTRLSFESAMHRLGGRVLSAEGLQFSSLYKGETIEDTMMMAGQYADIIVMRHPDKGSAAIAASASPVPFINAGDGPGEHPTQALLDLYTIQKERGTLEGLHIAMAGDLLYGRTVHSLSVLLSLYPGVRFSFLSPKELRIPEKVTSVLRASGLAYEELDTLAPGLDADVLYMTRVQKERFTDAAEYERLKHAFILTGDQLKGKTVTVLHPLPRVGEITTDVDALPNAAYFRQAGNGVPVRMALLALLLGKA